MQMAKVKWILPKGKGRVLCWSKEDDDGEGAHC